MRRSEKGIDLFSSVVINLLSLFCVRFNLFGLCFLGGALFVRFSAGVYAVVVIHVRQGFKIFSYYPEWEASRFE